MKQVEALSQDKEITATQKDKQEVLNYIEALEKIPEFAPAGTVSTEILLKIHKIIRGPVDELVKFHYAD